MYHPATRAAHSAVEPPRTSAADPGLATRPSLRLADYLCRSQLLDFTREAGLNAGVVATDAALHAGLCTLADLEASYATCTGRAGLRCGRQLFELLDGRSESPLESISRLALAPLEPSPRTQVTLRAPTGQFLGRVDFYWDELRVVGEADGRLKYTGEELWNEKLRQDRLTEHGFVVVRWGWAEANHPQLLRAKVSRALNRASRL